MKKSIIILTVCALMMVVLGSCGTNKKCPAYSLHNTEKTTTPKA